ncbi:MAG: HlyD family efflux transporter periplasmic adaptor subunit [Planctomycetes bacterium]|nr:HlyD family efflux transporter periplasmic adaptor subunit [Planctomycetota bacterium]
MTRNTVFFLLVPILFLVLSSRNFAQETPDRDSNPAAAESTEEQQGQETDKKDESQAASNGAPAEDKQQTSDDNGTAEAEKKEEAGSAAPEGEQSQVTEDKPDADAKKDTEKAKKRKTHAVKPERFKIDVGFDGTFVAREMEMVALRPEDWSDYEIIEVVAHGETVHEGQTLVKFDDRKLNEAIADLELEQRLSEIAIRREEEELPRLEKTLAMNLDEAERNNQEAREDFDRYNEIDRPMAVKSANFMAKYYQFMVDYEKEELDQLEKMYKADDLTEETEEVILKRQRNSVEFAEFGLESARLMQDETLHVQLPRRDIRIKESLQRAELALARAKLAAQLDMNRVRYELEQKKQARTKSLNRHAKLLGDRALMELKAPVDGVVYYGQCTNGQWSDTASLMAKLRPKNSVSSGTVLMTIVDPRPIYVTANFDEKHRPELEVGRKAGITPPAANSKSIDGKVAAISPIPVSTGKFEIHFDLDEGELPEWIVAGVNCKAKVTTYDKKDVLAVPKAALHTDEDDEDQHYVWVVDPNQDDAKPERRCVEVGKRNGDQIEITGGLKEGDVVSLEDESKKDEQKKE